MSRDEAGPRLPAWVRATGFGVGALLLGGGALCWMVPHALFGPEGYRTVARGIIGLLGGLAMGLGASIALAASRREAGALCGGLRAAFLALAGIPAVVFFNFGAVEPLREATGVNLLMLAAGALLLALPCHLALRVLRRLGPAATGARYG